MLISKSLPDRLSNKPIAYIATLEDKNVTLRQHLPLTDVTRVRFPNLVVLDWNKICCLFSSLLEGFSVYPHLSYHPFKLPYDLETGGEDPLRRCTIDKFCESSDGSMDGRINSFTPQHQYVYSPHCSPYIT